MHILPDMDKKWFLVIIR